MKTAAYFVENQHGTVLAREIFHAFKEPWSGFHKIRWLHDDGCELPPVRIQKFVEAREIVIDEGLGQLPHRFWHPALRVVVPIYQSCQP